MNIKPLTEFRSNRRDYTLLEQCFIGKTIQIMLFEGKHTTNNKIVVNYEVHKCRVKPLDEKPFTHYWLRAGASDFGQYGWCYKVKKDAINKFKEVLDDQP